MEVCRNAKSEQNRQFLHLFDIQYAYELQMEYSCMDTSRTSFYIRYLNIVVCRSFGIMDNRYIALDERNRMGSQLLNRNIAGQRE